MMLAVNGQSSSKKSYELTYITGEKNSVRATVEVGKVGGNVQLNVASLVQQEKVTNGEPVRVQLGDVFTTASNVNTCEKFIVDVNKNLEPIHIEQADCRDALFKRLKQNVVLRSSLRNLVNEGKSGQVNFDGVATPKKDKENAPENNQSFFRKYWYFIVPLVLMVLVNSM